jgi:hypothetical protein
MLRPFPSRTRHPELVSGSIPQLSAELSAHAPSQPLGGASLSTPGDAAQWMLKQVQHDGLDDGGANG